MRDRRRRRAIAARPVGPVAAVGREHRRQRARLAGDIEDGRDALARTARRRSSWPWSSRFQPPSSAMARTAAIRSAQVAMPVRSLARSARSPAVGNGVGAALARRSGDAGGATAAGATPPAPRVSSSAAASARIRPFRAAGGSTTGTALGEHREHRSELGDLGVRIGARRQVRPDGSGLVRLERAEHERAGRARGPRRR